MKYTLFQALEIVAGTKRKIIIKDVEANEKTQRSYDGWNFYFRGQLTNDNSYEWWPTTEQEKAQIWEVEEAPIYVWGACDGDDDSFIYNSKPEINDNREWCPIRGGELYFGKVSLFPKDKPQKYKLVPVED